MRVKINCGVRIWLSKRDTYNWANKTGAMWPCSTLSNKSIYADFDESGDLVDILINGKHQDCDNYEFDAIIEDFLGDSHPAIKYGWTMPRKEL